MKRSLTTILICVGLVAGCEKEPPPARTVDEFLENPILLEAAMVRCSRDQYEYRYDQECINAREAVKRVQTVEEEAKRNELEARSERKRQALRRTQEAQAEARRRSEEAERLRKEAEYLAQFGVLPPATDDGEEEALPAGNVPTVVLPQADVPETPTDTYGDALPATDGGNAPVAETLPPEEDPGN